MMYEVRMIVDVPVQAARDRGLDDPTPGEVATLIETTIQDDLDFTVIELECDRALVDGRSWWAKPDEAAREDERQGRHR